MKAAIRIFALLVAFAGLASASFSTPSSHALQLRMSVGASDPGPLTIPGPFPCPGCLVPYQSNR